MDIICKRCTTKISLIAAKKLGSNFYCPKCYDYVMNSIRAGYKMPDED